MKRQAFYNALICSMITLVFISCQPETISLWNGQDFSGWEFYVADDEVDVNTVWTIRNGVIHCKGVPNGYMRTKSNYENYILYLEWRWVEKEGNSGVLLHTQLPDQVWPLCIETQLQTGNAGDFVLIGEGTITVDGEKFTNSNRFLVIPKQQQSSEKAVGEWNSYKIICDKDEIACYVNDVLQNRGIQASLSKGKICFQSEGAPIEFRNIRIEMLK
jgi:hypothetical protein